MRKVASRTPIAKECADFGLEDCGLECALCQCRCLGPPRSTYSLADLDSAQEKAQNAPVGSSRGQF
eukprot:1674173-Alexandrium_andersonii.AAC.1